MLLRHVLGAQSWPPKKAAQNVSRELRSLACFIDGLDHLEAQQHILHL
jgi:hypothetical protein